MPEPSAEKEEETFEAALARLEDIVKRLEEGDVPLDEAIATFETGLALLRGCRARLEAAELRVRELMEPDAP